MSAASAQVVKGSASAATPSVRFARSGSRAAPAVPASWPTAAAATTSPTSSPDAPSARSRKARKMVSSPASARSAMAEASGPVSTAALRVSRKRTVVADGRDGGSSTCAGSRSDSTPPSTSSRLARRSTHDGPTSAEMPEPTAAAAAPAATAATFSRAFADTRPTPSGRTRGTAAARATP